MPCECFCSRNHHVEFQKGEELGRVKGEMELRGGGEGLLFLLSPSFLRSEIKDGRHVYDICGTRKNKKDHLEFESIIT